MPTTHLDELGELQRSVLDLLWERGELTVAEVRTALTEPDREPAYTTVLSVIQKLEKRGWLTHRRDGRTHVYRAARTRSEAGRGTVRGLVERLFSGRPQVVMQHLVDDERVTAEELAALRATIDARLARIEAGDASADGGGDGGGGNGDDSGRPATAPRSGATS